MSKNYMRKLEDFTAWQYELAIIASRFKLRLLTENQMIAFTHKLMDKGYYDNGMLEIIDNDPLFATFSIEKNFEKLWEILAFPVLSTQESQYLNTLWRIFPLTQKPFNFDYFLILAKCSQFYPNFQDIFNEQYADDNQYIGIEDLIYNLYRLDDDLSFYENEMIGLNEVLLTFFEFLQECENWIDCNQPKILQIMHQLFPK